MSNSNKVLGMVLLAEKDESIKIFNLINQDWMLTEFQMVVYDAIKDLFSRGEYPDILNVTETAIKDKRYKKEYLIEVSKLTNNITHLDIMHVGSYLGRCAIEHTERRANILTHNLHNMLSNGIFDYDRYTKLLSEALNEVEIKSEQTITNTDIVFNILDAHHKAKKGELSGIKLPYSSFDRVVLIEDVDLVVIGARPAMGKTAFVVSTATSMARKGLKVLIFALEMSSTQMMRRVLANITAIDSNKIKYGECNNFELVKIQRVQEGNDLDNIKIIEGSQTINDIARIVSIEQPDIVFVDYLQKIKPERNEDIFTSVTRASNGLKELAQNKHIPIIAMAQLSRPESQKVGRRPSLPDLRQSGEIEQDASIVGFLHRPEYYGDEVLESGGLSSGMCEVIIAKNREGETGVYPMKVNLKISKFMDADPIYIDPQRSLDSDNPF